MSGTKITKIFLIPASGPETIVFDLAQIDLFSLSEELEIFQERFRDRPWVLVNYYDPDDLILKTDLFPQGDPWSSQVLTTISVLAEEPEEP